jgi:hypothetical protein
MKNFRLYLKDMQTGKIGAANPNINTANVHRKVLQYKVKDLRKGIYQPWRTRFRKNRLYNPKRYLNRISNKIKEEKMVFSFKSFLNEAAFVPNPPMDTHMKTHLFSTVHSKERGEERDANEDVVKHIFKKAVEHVKKNHTKYSSNEHFVVTSKKHNRSASFNYRPDNQSSNDTRSHFIHTSTFPKGEHYCNAACKKIVVEGIEIEYILIEVE